MTRLIDARQLIKTWDTSKSMVDNIDIQPTVDAVPMGVFEQVMWERDIAIAQLTEHGIGFCEKKKDLVEVVRCKDCICFLPNRYLDSEEYPNPFKADGLCTSTRKYTNNNDYCSYGERE